MNVRNTPLWVIIGIVVLILVIMGYLHYGGQAPSPAPSHAAVKALATPFPTRLKSWVDLANNGIPAAGALQLARYADIAMEGSGGGITRQLQAASIKVAIYSEPNHYLPGGTMAIEKLFSMADVARTCNGQPVRWLQGPGTTYLTDIRNPVIASIWKQSLEKIFASNGQADYVFEDTSDNPYSAASPAPPCGAHGQIVFPSVWTSAEKAMESTLGYPVVFNGLANGSNKIASYAVGLLYGPAAGGLSEVCYSTYDYPTGVLKNSGTAWEVNEQTELTAGAQQRIYVCQASETTDGSAPAAIDARLYQYASFALTYRYATSYYSSHWAVGSSGVMVQPEIMLVPNNPVAPEPTNIAALLGKDGAYHREYQHCTIAGIDFQHCDVVVNPSATKTVILAEPFSPTHHLVLAGSGVLDGGNAALGTGAPASLGPEEGAVLFQ
jgi:hypothetical protein